uniref:GNAT family N-acetyltransferase n=1 Tax=Acidisphaera sp. L21 TaxID=1641851 RepID=UPI00131BB893
CALGETTGAGHRHRLAAAGIPAFASPEQAVQGFRHLLQLRRARAAAQELPPSDVLAVQPDRDVMRAAIAAARADNCPALTKAEAGRVLAAYGIASAGPPIPVTVADDPLFGPSIGVGEGRMDDRAFDLPPLNLPLARGLVAHTPGARALSPGQANALADTLVRISQLILDWPEIAALALQSGAASLTLRPPGEFGRPSIAPYPAELAEQWTAHDGEIFTIRPIRPEDAAAHTAFFTRISPEDIRYRFFSALRELSPERTVRMTQVDYDREMAFIAVRANGDTAGVARLVRDRDEGEFAVIVQTDLKGRGIARRLMHRLVEWGQSQGMTAIVGQVLSENRPMLAFIRQLGFTLRRVPDEPEVVEARLRLQPSA